MRLSAHDASFLYTETASGPMHGVGITVLDGPATYQEIFDYYAARIHLVPRFRQKLAFVPYNLAHPKWVDDPDFRLENHIQLHPVPPHASLDDAIQIALELGERLLDRRRPLWMTYVLEDVAGHTVLAQMSHHAFVDGATAVAMSMVLTDPAPDAAPPAPEGAWQPAPEPTPLQHWGQALREQARAQLEVATGGFKPQDPEITRKALALMARMARPVMQAPWNAGLVGPRRRFAAAEYPLDAFKTIRKALAGTVNDIVVAVVMEGAARYLKSHGEYVQNQYLRLMCPVNLRDGDVDPTNLDGNRVSAMFPVLPAWPMPIEERYGSTRLELDRIKNDDEPRTLDALQQQSTVAPPVAMAGTRAIGTPFDPTADMARRPPPVPRHFGPRPLQTGFNFTCTNVPGPTWKQYVASYGITSATGTMMLGGNLGFGVGVSSSNGIMTFGLTADPRLMPDVETMRDFVVEAFEDLTEVARQRLVEVIQAADREAA